MALTANTIPSQVPFYATPYDAATAFALNQVIAATGYLTNVNAILDLGSATPVAAAGRLSAMWVLDVTSVDMSSNDESYWFELLGSNDSAFGNGNVELLAFYDFASVTAGRVTPTLLGASPTIPPTNAGGMILQKPFTNLSLRIVYRYLKCRVIIAGTTPTITVSTWISSSGVDF